MKYFKVKTGYLDSDFIPIDETELEKALRAFVSDGSKVIFNGGAVRGRDIISITEDWHRALGFNYGYRLVPEDFEIINKKLPEYKGFIESVKIKIIGSTPALLAA